MRREADGLAGRRGLKHRDRRLAVIDGTQPGCGSGLSQAADPPSPRPILDTLADALGRNDRAGADAAPGLAATIRRDLPVGVRAKPQSAD